MRTRLRWIPLCLALFLALPAGSYVLFDSRWPGAASTFYVDIFNPTFGVFSPSGPSWDSAFLQAAGYWNGATSFNLATSSTFSDPCNLADTRNGVDFTLTHCGVAFGSTTLALTTIRSFGTIITETDIVFNDTDFLWDVYSGPLGGFEDFRRVAAHELGHAVGLDHSSSGTLLAPFVSNIEVPQPDDINGVGALYGGCNPPPINISASSVSFGSLVVTDCMLSEEGGQDDSLFDTYSVTTGVPGTFDVELESNDFDAFLWLTDESFNEIATDDDSGTGFNARLVQAVPAGSYFLLANTFDGESGSYTLTSTFTPSVPHTLGFTLPASGSPNPVASAGTVSVSALAADSLGHSIAYTWSASCPGLGGNGNFSNASSATSTWTAPPNLTVTGQVCTLQVLASGSSGLNTMSQYSQTVNFVDSDGDGFADTGDNCPHFSNPGQADVGGLGVGSPPDGVGDACQCGDASGDGFVTTADALIIRRALLVPPTAAMARPDLCDVGGSPACSSADPLILRRALLVPPTAGIVQQCAPSLP